MSAPSAPPASRRARLVVTVAAVLAFALTARLGVWQLDRADQKLALRTAVEQAEAQPPLDAAGLLPGPDALATQLHRHVVVEGRWLPEHTVFLENRQMDGQPGFFVLTPLLLPSGDALVIQRGWAPRHRLDRSLTPEAPLPEGPVRLLGRMAPPPARLVSLGDEAGGALRQNLDLAEHARATGLALRPYTLYQLDEAASPQDGLRRDWPRPAVGVDKHHGYAFQWFALAGLIWVLYVWFQILRPRRRR
ncbi:SURF1 family protein [Piscinibacter sp. Jin2]|uniref:SURF1-like protein n=1 Tax=Aquariibacter lacus TaxID=2801332 RepID=A0A9X1BN44_9BURK|nr:SURF1 family protein [Piscinibacter lacus]MBL0719205.1 SURF1 family protein [Piscinibacter lacus]